MATTQYVGARYVPRHMGEWDANTQYGALDVVLYTDGNSYTAKCFPPKGTPPTIDQYWALSAQFNQQLANINEKINNTAKQIESTDNFPEVFTQIGDYYYTKQFAQTGKGRALYKIVETATANNVTVFKTANAFAVLYGDTATTEQIGINNTMDCTEVLSAASDYAISMDTDINCVTFRLSKIYGNGHKINIMFDSGVPSFDYAENVEFVAAKYKTAGRIEPNDGAIISGCKFTGFVYKTLEKYMWPVFIRDRTCTMENCNMNDSAFGATVEDNGILFITNCYGNDNVIHCEPLGGYCEVYANNIRGDIVLYNQQNAAKRIEAHLSNCNGRLRAHGSNIYEDGCNFVYENINAPYMISNNWENCKRKTNMLKDPYFMHIGNNGWATGYNPNTNKGEVVLDGQKRVVHSNIGGSGFCVLSQSVNVEKGKVYLFSAVVKSAYANNFVRFKLGNEMLYGSVRASDKYERVAIIYTAITSGELTINIGSNADSAINTNDTFIECAFFGEICGNDNAFNGYTNGVDAVPSGGTYPTVFKNVNLLSDFIFSNEENVVGYKPTQTLFTYKSVTAV